MPDGALYRLLDAVTVVSGELTFAPLFTGAAPGMVGTTVMKLKIGEELRGGLLDSGLHRKTNKPIVAAEYARAGVFARSPFRN